MCVCPCSLQLSFAYAFPAQVPFEGTGRKSDYTFCTLTKNHQTNLPTKIFNGVIPLSWPLTGGPFKRNPHQTPDLLKLPGCGRHLGTRLRQLYVAFNQFKGKRLPRGPNPAPTPPNPTPTQPNPNPTSSAQPQTLTNRNPPNPTTDPPTNPGPNPTTTHLSR